MQGDLALSYEEIIDNLSYKAEPPPLPIIESSIIIETNIITEVQTEEIPVIEAPIIDESLPIADAVDFFSRCRKSGLIKN
jgi:hypothetical protein